MKTNATYETIYAHDRRAHRHRCQCCSRIIDAGEAVIMWRLGKRTRALHRDCAEATHDITHRQLAEMHLAEMYGAKR